jgi:hypothetical protein
MTLAPFRIRAAPLNGRGFLMSKNRHSMRLPNDLPLLKKVEDFGGALKFLCYSLPLSKGLCYLPI